MSCDQTFDVIVEIPKGGRMKYEMDDNHRIVLDRVLPLGLSYPANYGFIPQTLACDGDALDAIVLTDYSLHIKCRIECRPIGVLIMTDEKGMDEKIIMIPCSAVDESYSHIHSLTDLSPRTLQEIKIFFETYKNVEKDKWTKVDGFQDASKAYELIVLYLDKFTKSQVSAYSSSSPDKRMTQNSENSESKMNGNKNTDNGWLYCIRQQQGEENTYAIGMAHEISETRDICGKNNNNKQLIFCSYHKDSDINRILQFVYSELHIHPHITVSTHNKHCFSCKTDDTMNSILRMIESEWFIIEK